MTDFSIGLLASDAGVSVQTLRHYDAIGLLRPAARSRAGYRLYSANDRAKLDVIRTLRELDFDLPTIGRLLAGKARLSEGAALQLRALEYQSRLVRRRMSVLRVFLQTKGELDARRLKQLETLARLGREDQQRFVSDELRHRMGHNTPPAMRDTLTRLAMIELPESPTEGQLDAWLELADLVADPGFLAHYAGRIACSVSPDTDATWRDRNARVLESAVAAQKVRMDPASPAAKAIARRWLSTAAAQAGRKDVKQFAREMLAAIDTGRHAPEQRFWELLALLRPEIARSPQLVAGEWLVTATRSWVSGDSSPLSAGSRTRN